VNGPAATTRNDALERAERHAPFLRDAIAARPDIVEIFLAKGARAAACEAVQAGAETADSELRRRRQGLAMAVALGDLSGELDLEQVTELLSDFADQSIDRAIEVAVAELFAGEKPRGLAVIALGKLGSRELNFSSDVDLILLFDPARLPRRGGAEPGDSAVRIGRRMVELLQKRTEDGYVARVDLEAPAVAGSHAHCSAGECGDLLL
jgi:[glutamine synthetase] adenylyltransferase / [glutamine synthetase]-adenylyl-L-tyrosine phosphorylase